MKINKVMVYVFCIVTSATLSAMELEKSQGEKRSLPRDIMNRAAESSSRAYSFSFSLPTLSGVGNSVNSAINTFNNYWYDEEAFKKLGWPEHDQTAQQELANTLQIYKRVNDYFVTRKAYIDLIEDRRVIGRRSDYLRRVLEKLPEIPKRSEALDLATFCLNNHSQAMNDFIKSDFLLFISVETGKSIQEVQKTNSELLKLKIVSEPLNALYEQAAKEKSKK